MSGMKLFFKAILSFTGPIILEGGNMITIAVDAMGGDNAPESSVKGALAAAKEWDNIAITLVGDERKIRKFMDADIPSVRIRHTEEMILSDDEPVRAVRRKKDASMVIAGKMVKDGEADAMISAGNTGALMATGLLIIGRVKGVERPGLAPLLPTNDGEGVLAVDLGSNMDATPNHLLQYAIMGSMYRKAVDGIESPRVGLLNVGTEMMKGNELTKAAYSLLEQAPIHFVGNVEARDVMHRECDVLVCDGFAGNIMLKAMEGTAGVIMSALKEEFMRTLITKMAGAVLRPGLNNFRQKVDYREHGGAQLLGINGVCIKGHGSSDANAMKNAVRQAKVVAEMAKKHRLFAAISDEFSRK